MAYNKNNSRKKPTPEAMPAWSNVNGAMRVFGKPRTTRNGCYMTFSTSIGRKDDSGQYKNVYFDVLFRKGEQPDIEGEFHINIKDGFLTLREFPNKDGGITVNPAVMVLDYDFI